MKSLFIIEDHPVMRGALGAWFSATGRWELRGSAGSLEEARERLTGEILQDLTVLLLDMELKTTYGGSEWGLDITGLVRLKAPRCAIIVYSNYDDPAHIQAALSSGARAFVNKSRSESELENAINTALAGNVFIDERAEKNFTLFNDYRSRLTRREAEIFNLVQKGLTNREIAATLSINKHTVENILGLIYAKTGLSRVEIQKL